MKMILYFKFIILFNFEETIIFFDDIVILLL